MNTAAAHISRLPRSIIEHPAWRWRCARRRQLSTSSPPPPPPPPPAELVHVTAKDGTLYKLHPAWLRDHCQCALCVHPTTHQRLSDEHLTSPLATQVAYSKGSQIHWRDGHVSCFESAWLRHNAPSSDRADRDDLHDDGSDPAAKYTSRPRLWRASDLARAPPTSNYEEIMSSDAGAFKWLCDIATYGVAFVTGVPHAVGPSRALAERIAYVRETQYGGYWDFAPDLEHADTAYTAHALPLHTDTTYFTDPIRIQMFHLLEYSHLDSGGGGGETIIADGLRAVLHLRETAPWAFDALTSTPVTCRTYTAPDGADAPNFATPAPRAIVRTTVARARARAFEDVEEEGEEEGPREREAKVDLAWPYLIAYNNCDRAPLRHVAQGAPCDVFYRALSRLAHLLNAPDSVHVFAMRPGVAVFLDNWRVLHGRKAFPATARRRLTGCYISNDEFRARLRALARRTPE